jgi:hypothetical protein
MLLMAGFVLAGEEARNPASPSAAKSVLGNLQLTGINQQGIPGYLEFNDNTGGATADPASFYLWVGSDGKLRISSGVAVGTGASPSTISPWKLTSGTVVGLQS